MAITVQHIPEQDDKILRRKQVESDFGLSRSSIYDLMSKGQFPKPIAIGPRSVGWLRSELVSWRKERIARRDSKRG